MREAMKHRLVGAAVLVALGVIVWPVLFDASPVREISQRSQIPPAPIVERFSIDEPQPPQLPPEPDSAAQRAEAAAVIASQPAAAAVLSEALPAAAEIAPSIATDAATAAAHADTVPQVHKDAYGLPVQWALQLGVFTRIEGAQEVKRRAEAAGYHAILQSVAGKDGAQHRVFIGPKLDRNAAESLGREVQQKLGIAGYVTRYYP